MSSTINTDQSRLTFELSIRKLCLITVISEKKWSQNTIFGHLNHPPKWFSSHLYYCHNVATVPTMLSQSCLRYVTLKLKPLTLVSVLHMVCCIDISPQHNISCLNLYLKTTFSIRFSNCIQCWVVHDNLWRYLLQYSKNSWIFYWYV